MKRKKQDAVKFGASSNYRSKKHGRAKMRSECIAEVSRSNFDSAIEAMLRAVDKIHDSETPQMMRYTFSKTDATVQVTVLFQTQEEKKTVDHSVH
jgi:hypothetical protein